LGDHRFSLPVCLALGRHYAILSLLTVEVRRRETVMTVGNCFMNATRTAKFGFLQGLI
jgi:hypothetical protein